MGNVQDKERKRVKLIYNPSSGEAGKSPEMLADVISKMQALDLVPETFLLEPDGDLPSMVQNALKDGIRLFVVCGGDGTVDVIAGALVGTDAILGIIPAGTRNNVALSLGIPTDIPAAIDILRTGQPIVVDTGLAEFGEMKRPFLEISSVGLISALFPAADDIQHGKLTRVGDLLSTLAASSPAEMHLVLDGEREVNTTCHVVLVNNVPYVGPNLQVGVPASMNDGLLNVLLFADLSKMDLLSLAAQVAWVGGGQEDDRIQQYQVERVDIRTNPAMPVMADGEALGEGPLRIQVQPQSLSIMVGELTPTIKPDPK